MDDAPVRVSRRGGIVSIEFHLEFRGKYAALPYPSSPYTYAEAVARGIIAHWGAGGVRSLEGFAEPGSGPMPPDRVSVRAAVYSRCPSPAGVWQPPPDARRAVTVHLKDRPRGTAEHVFTAGNNLFDLFRLPGNFADALKSGQLERLLYNWSVDNPGTVYLYPCDTLEDQMAAAAHEAGHLLGVGDAYGSGLYRLGEACPPRVRGTNPAGRPAVYDVPEDDMMRGGRRVSHYDIVLALKAFRTGLPQFFLKGDDSTTRAIRQYGLRAVLSYLRQGKIHF